MPLLQRDSNSFLLSQAFCRMFLLYSPSMQSYTSDVSPFQPDFAVCVQVKGKAFKSPFAFDHSLLRSNAKKQSRFWGIRLPLKVVIQVRKRRRMPLRILLS
jgi:hypothetical protein